MRAITSNFDVEVAPEIWDTKLSPGSFIVVHRVFNEVERPRVIAIERHDLAEV
jgi:hypothetical protein